MANEYEKEIIRKKRNIKKYKKESDYDKFDRLKNRKKYINNQR